MKKYITPLAVHNTTFCVNCDEVICACSHANYVPRYTIIEGEAYIVKEEK